MAPLAPVIATMSRMRAIIMATAMKRIFTSSSLWQAREVLSLLEERHIPGVLGNEHLAATPGVLPVNAQMSADVEVWLLNDEDEGAARRIIERWSARDRGAGRWHCPRCGEDNPGTFEWCWACGSAPTADRDRAPS